MKFYTTVYPIFVNETPDGVFEYGFLTGEQTKLGTLFSGSDVVRRTFPKKQDFKFLSPVKTQIVTPDEFCDEETWKSGKRLFSSKGEKILRIVGNNLGDLKFTSEAVEEEAK